MSKVVELPITNERKFNAALQALRDGNTAGALEEAKKLIDGGYAHAYTLAGAICERGGQNLTPNLEHALFYYERAIEEVGALEAWLSVGRIYFFGRGVKPNYQKALSCYSTVYEETKNPLAGMMLARFYAEGKGVPVDCPRAESYLLEAVRKGYAFAPTQLAALEFREGRLVKALVHWLQGVWRAIRIPKGDGRLRPY